jgi:hypothetical protein
VLALVKLNTGFKILGALTVKVTVEPTVAVVEGEAVTVKDPVPVVVPPVDKVHEVDALFVKSLTLTSELIPPAAPVTKVIVEG